MAITQADIDSLNSAIASGTRSVTLGGQTVTYGTVDALIKARNDLLDQMNKLELLASGKTRRRMTMLHYVGRGF